MEIAAAMQDNARQHFAGLLERHRGIGLKVAHSYCRHPDDRADLAQDIAAQLWRAFPGYDAARASFSTWMYRIALNVAISHVRSSSLRGRHSVPLDDEALLAGDGDDHEGDEHLRLLHDFIARQDPLHRALLLLYLDERSHREIADVLGISEANVATKISRLKQRLRNEFA
jgi:RNA polymerase sigma-70 factor (ECF subfamily)